MKECAFSMAKNSLIILSIVLLILVNYTNISAQESEVLTISFYRVEDGYLRIIKGRHNGDMVYISFSDSLLVWDKGPDILFYHYVDWVEKPTAKSIHGEWESNMDVYMLFPPVFIPIVRGSYAS